MNNENNNVTSWIKEVAKAAAYLHLELMDMGDSFECEVEMLCQEAAVLFDRDCEAFYEDEEYLNKKCKEAYEILLPSKKDDRLSYFVETLVENEEYFVNNLKFVKSSNIATHPTFQAMLVIANFLTSQEESCFVHLSKAETEEKMRNLLWRFLQLDMEVIHTGYVVSSEYWRYLDSNYYFRSNTSYKVGYVPGDEDMESTLGGYVAHACLMKPGDYGYFDCGYAVGYTRKNEVLVAHLYRVYKKEKKKDFTVKDTGVELVLTENHEENARKIAEMINQLTVAEYELK